MSNTRNLGELLESDGEVPSSKIDSIAATKLTGTVATARLPSAALYTHPNHSGDVVSVADGAMTIQVDAVDIPMLSATGTASNTTFLRGDNAWAVPIGGVTSVNSETGAITAAHIATAVEAASDSNTFTDADHTKLNAIEASADVTDTTNVVAALTAGTGVTISGGGTIAAGPIALTTVQTAANQSAHLALTAQEGDIVVRSDENKTYCHNGGSAGNMTDYTLLATPTDVVLSVAGNTGAVTAAQIATAVEAASGSNTFTDADHTKLNAIEASADVTDATNVTAAGALMDSEVTNLAAVKSFAASDYATAAQGTLAAAALPKAGGTMTGTLTGTSFQATSMGVTKWYQSSNSGNPEFYIGASDTNRLGIQTVYQGGSQVLDRAHFFTQTSSGSANAGYMTFSVDDGAEKLRIDDAGVDVTGILTTTGNVGIGTTSADYKLHVEHTTAADNRTVAVFKGTGNSGSQATGGQYVSIQRIGAISNGADNIAGGLLLGISPSVTAANCGIRGTYEYSNGRDLDFFTSSDNTSAPTTKMVIKGNGRVGIGTTTPGAPLNVRSTADGTIQRFSRSGVCDWDISIGNTPVLTGVGAGALEIIPQNGNMQFCIGKAGTTTANFVIASNGQIGVGGTNYGTDGQVLTSTGASTAPAWEDASGATHTSAGSAPGSPAIGDFWHDTTNEKLYIRTNDGTSNIWMQI